MPPLPRHDTDSWKWPGWDSPAQTENHGKHKNDDDHKVVDVDWKSLGLKKAKIRRLEKRIEKGNENEEKEKVEQKSKGKYMINIQSW